MRRIVFVLGSMGNGGAERVISLLANCLAERHVEVHIVTIFGEKTDYELDSRIIRHFVSGDTKFRPLRSFKRILSLRQYIKHIAPDCVISFLAEVNIYSIIAMAGCRIPLIISERNDPNNDPVQSWKRTLRDFLYRFADGAVFQTQDAKKYFSGRLKASCIQDVIYNPLSPDLPRKTFWSETGRFITACRLDQQKNLPLMISAISEVIGEGYDCTLDIYGRGPLYDSLNGLIGQLGKASKIHLCGFSSDIHNEMCDSDAFIISSNYEGISNSMIEALAVGIPVIATDCPIGGAREFISDNENGYLIPVDDKNELKKCIKRVINRDYDTEKIKKSADSIRRLLDRDKILDQWISDIEIMIRQAGRRR